MAKRKLETQKISRNFFIIREKTYLYITKKELKIKQK